MIHYYKLFEELIMNYKIAVCDDDNNICKALESYISKYSFQIDTNIEVSIYNNGKALLDEYKANKSFDILLLDVEMPDINGIETAKKIRTDFTKETLVIFISNYPEYMQDSFTVHPYYYITKPVAEQTFFNVLSEALMELSEKNSFMVIEDMIGRKVVIHLKDLMYIENNNAKLKEVFFYMTDEIIRVHGTIKEWTKRLEDYNFVNCYRGVIINLEYIHTIWGGKVELRNGKSFKISRGKECELKDKYIDKIIRPKLK